MVDSVCFHIYGILISVFATCIFSVTFKLLHVGSNAYAVWVLVGSILHEKVQVQWIKNHFSLRNANMTFVSERQGRVLQD
jgi:multidrug transporter EmrE-like cation transporter